MADLSTVNKTLQAQNREQQTTSKELTELNAKFDQFIRIAQGDRMDALDEKRKLKAKDNSAGKGLGKAEKDPMMFPGLLGLQGILASIAALGAAFAGLRGWEVRAIQSLSKQIPDFTKTFSNGVTKLINSTLERLGFKAVMETDAKGKFTTGKGISPLERIRRAINTRYTKIIDGLVDSIKAFKPGALIGEDAAKALGKVKSVSKVALAPIIFLLDDIGKVVRSIGGMVGKESTAIVQKLVKNAGKFAGLVGKVLKPIGFIFSFAEGITEAFKTDGDIFDKLTAGVSRFVADFIGAPLDLLKDLASWILKKLGFEEVSKSLDDFSIEESIFGLLKGVFSFLKKIFTGDFSGAGQMIMDLVGGFMRMLGDAINKIVGKLGFDPIFDFRSEQEKELEAVQKKVEAQRAAIAESQKAIDDRLSGKTKKKAFQGNYFSTENLVKRKEEAIAKSEKELIKLAALQTKLSKEIAENAKMTTGGAGTTVITDASSTDNSTSTQTALALPQGSVTDKSDYSFGGNTAI